MKDLREVTMAAGYLVSAAIVLCYLFPCLDMVMAEERVDQTAPGDWPPESPISRDARVQEELRRLEAIFVSLGRDAPPEIYGRFWVGIDGLKQTVKNDRVALYHQLLIYGRESKEELSWAVFGYVCTFAHIQPRDQVQALLPYLDTRDRYLVQLIRGATYQTEGPLSDHPNFADYEYLIREHFRVTGKGDESVAALFPLFRHMFARHPGQAVLSIGSVASDDRDEDREIMLAEHVVSAFLWLQEKDFSPDDATDPHVAEKLAEVAAIPKWYVRAYVARVLEDEPEFRTPDLMETLRSEQHVLVQEILARIDASSSPK